MANTTPRLASLRWFGLGFILVLGIAAALVGMMLFGTQGGGTDGAEALGEDAARALLIQRFGEWQLYEARLTLPEAWQRYREGERELSPGTPATPSDAWGAYRAGEHAPYARPVPTPPEG